MQAREINREWREWTHCRKTVIGNVPYSWAFQMHKLEQIATFRSPKSHNNFHHLLDVDLLAFTVFTIEVVIFVLTIHYQCCSNNALLLNKTLSNKQVPRVRYSDHSILILNTWWPGTLSGVSFPLNIIVENWIKRNHKGEWTKYLWRRYQGT